MGNSRWIGSRIGLVDFWYYGDQEYEFLDGRMLLRGANGSGKSVTMQSFVPLLLDGNMRPERLDPFGSKARKMENYLLEEDDTREERTGYLYMEFKREGSETYLTFGMGIRARKGKKLETWYFYIQDGRRVGRDFLLYKGSAEKLALTKTELRNRIGDGGSVIESQGEYESRVNSLLFGFETVEEYRELLSLLIQLRTPKLSKDFKPSVIHEILSRSLQTLSEDDLRPLSEAIENMDSLATNLRVLEEASRAAEDIQKVYDKYNKAVLLEKAERYLGAGQAWQKWKKETDLLEAERNQAAQDLAGEHAHFQALEQEYQVVDEEYRSLQDSDAAKLKEQEEKLLQEDTELCSLLQQKETKVDAKKEELREKEILLKSHQEEAAQIWAKVGDCFETIEGCMQDSAFLDWQYVIQDLKKEKGAPYDFSFQEGLLKEYQKRIQAGMETLRQERETRRQYGDALQELDARKEQRDAREKEWQQYEEMVQGQKGELTESIHVWAGKNQWLRLEPLVLQQMDRQVESFQYEDDYSNIRELADQKRQEVKNSLSNQSGALERDLRLLQEEKAKISAEIARLEQAEEVGPERPEEVLQNRKLLQGMGIPAIPFYKAVDFKAGLTPEQCGRLEAALAQMGILDALIVSSSYREQILRMDKEVCDKYLFTDDKPLSENCTDNKQLPESPTDNIPLPENLTGNRQMPENLTDNKWPLENLTHDKQMPANLTHGKQLPENLIGLFSAENAEGDTVLSMQIQSILSGIGYQSQALPSTWIAGDGHYRIGILEGTVSSHDTARYIGSTARERHRLECITRLEGSMREIDGKAMECSAQIHQLALHLEELQQEFEAFPRVDDLKVALREANRVQHLLEQAEDDVKRQFAVLQGWEQALKEIQIMVQETCQKTGLPKRLDAYQQEWEDLAEYREAFQCMKEQYQQYLNQLVLIDTRKEQLEGLTMDLDDFMSEHFRLKQQRNKCQASLRSVLEQLQLTDYASIQERLEHCRKRLNPLDGIPREREISIEKRSKLEKEIEYKTERLKEYTEKLQQADALRQQWQLVFYQELELGYVPVPNLDPQQAYGTASQVQSMLRGQLGGKGVYHLLGDLQNIYHEKRGLLTEYQPIIQKGIFEELAYTGSVSLPEEYVARIDIKAKYRGVPLPFLKLVSQLQAEADIQSNLLSEKDRELFEDILSNTISKKIRAKIHESNRWVEAMNRMMESMETSSGLTLSLKWQPKKADKEGQLDTKELVRLLQTDAEIMRQEDIDKISEHFRSCIREARKLSKEEANLQSFHVIMREILDYRKWFEFQLHFQKAGEKKKEMTDRMFFTFSGGEKAMSMYVPLFSAVVAKYKGANLDAPRIISLDEAFAGVDEMNIKDMFRLMVHLELNFIINSQVLWGDYDTVPKLAIYHLIRPLNAKCVTVMKYIWNGKSKVLL